MLHLPRRGLIKVLLLWQWKAQNMLSRFYLCYIILADKGLEWEGYRKCHTGFHMVSADMTLTYFVKAKANNNFKIVKTLLAYSFLLLAISSDSIMGKLNYFYIWSFFCTSMPIPYRFQLLGACVSKHLVSKLSWTAKNCNRLYHVR